MRPPFYQAEVSRFAASIAAILAWRFDRFEKESRIDYFHEGDIVETLREFGADGEWFKSNSENQAKRTISTALHAGHGVLIKLGRDDWDALIGIKYGVWLYHDSVFGKLEYKRHKEVLRKLKIRGETKYNGIIVRDSIHKR